MSTKEVKKTLLYFKEELGGEIVSFTGGEPLLRKDIFSLLNYSRGLGLKTTLGTNGSLIDEKNISYLKKYVTTITVSYDGPKKYFNEIRRGDFYEKTVQGIELLQNSHIPFGLHCNITPLNWKMMPYVIEFSKNMGALFLQLTHLENNKKIERYTGLKYRLLLDQDEMNMLYSFVKNYNKKHGDYILQNLVGKEEIESPKGKFSILSPFWVIRPDGSLFPMIDLDNIWKVSNNLWEFYLPNAKFSKFLDMLREVYKICYKKLLNGVVAVNPFSILQELCTKAIQR